MNFSQHLENTAGFLLASICQVSYNEHKDKDKSQKEVAERDISHRRRKTLNACTGNVTHMLAYCEQLQQDFHIEIVVNGRAVRH